MTKSLEERLNDAKGKLREVDEALGSQRGDMSEKTWESFRRIVSYQNSIEHWLATLDARADAFHYLDRLELNVDSEGRVLLGTISVKFRHARFIGVQAYLTSMWALADSLTGMVGQVVCTREKCSNDRELPKLVPNFIRRKSAAESVAAPFFHSLRESYGWPISVLYAIRNHFVHDAGYANGVDFFQSSLASSAFGISEGGWERVEKQAMDDGVTFINHRGGEGWLAEPRDDLRTVFRECEIQLDDALGILVGSACAALRSHLAFFQGQE